MYIIIYVSHLLMRFDLSCNYNIINKHNKTSQSALLVIIYKQSLSQSVVHVMTLLQPWFSVQSIVRAALNTNPRVFGT